MISVEWDKTKQWSEPQVLPYDDIIMHPFNSALHYAISCLDSVRAFKDESGNIRLFRPETCISRFNTSCWRSSLPQFDEEEMKNLVMKLVNLERESMATPSITSLRLLAFSLEVFHPLTSGNIGVIWYLETQSTLGVKAPTRSTIKMFGLKRPLTDSKSEVKLMTTHKFERSSPKQTGSHYVASYPTLSVSFKTELEEN